MIARNNHVLRYIIIKNVRYSILIIMIGRSGRLNPSSTPPIAVKDVGLFFEFV